MRARYVGPDKVLRTPWGAVPRDEPFEVDEDQKAYLVDNLPKGHVKHESGDAEPVAASNVLGVEGPATRASKRARTKPAPAVTKETAKGGAGNGAK